MSRRSRRCSGHVLHSIVANAIEATPPGGRVSGSLRAAGGKVEIRISDTGRGIPAEQLKKIFGPFFTTKAQGLGIGLTLAYRIIERFGGHIDVRQHARRGHRIHRDARGGLSMPTLFLIEDEATFAKNVASYLSRYGWDVETAPSAEEALERAGGGRARRDRARFQPAGHERPGGAARAARARSRGARGDAHRAGQRPARRGRDESRHRRLPPQAGGARRSAAAGRPPRRRRPHAQGTRLLPPARCRRPRQAARRMPGDAGAQAARAQRGPGRTRRRRRAAALGADHRRDRHRQGNRGARLPLREPPARAALRRSELRLDSRQPARVGTVRPRARRVHRRARAQDGLFEAADGGSIFLDEIGEADLAVQAKLLKVLEDHRIRRVGSTVDRRVDVRVIAATNRDLEKRAQEGAFRADLLYRLRVILLALPPLRARGDDIALLAERAPAQGRAALRQARPRLLARGAREAAPAIPGRATCAKCATCSSRRCCSPPRRPSRPTTSCCRTWRPDRSAAAPGAGDSLELAAVERDLIRQALAHCGGNVTQAARQLGISRDTLRYRMEKHGLTRA